VGEHFGEPYDNGCLADATACHGEEAEMTATKAALDEIRISADDVS